jgi:hypothetical protein
MPEHDHVEGDPSGVDRRQDDPTPAQAMVESDPRSVRPDEYVDRETIEADHAAWAKGPRADRPPSPDEARAAEKAASLQPAGVAEAYDDMARRGAVTEGEGRIDV